MDTIGGTLINSYAGSIKAGDNEIYRFTMFCRSGLELRTTSAVSDLLIEGRIYGSGDAFTNLETDGLDVSPYNGTVQEFEVKITAGNVASRTVVFDLAMM